MWREWKGRNRFYCNGRLMNGSSDNNAAMIAGYGLFVIVNSLFNIIIAPASLEHTSLLWTLLSNVLGVVTIYQALRATFTDPGVIPRGNLQGPNESDVLISDNSPPKQEPETTQLEPATSTSQDGLSSPENSKTSPLDQESSADLNSHRCESVQLHGTQLDFHKNRYCNTCQIMRPPKASHCSMCNNCVKGFDHHCWFIGNCVGIRNMKYFVGFIVLSSLMMDVNAYVALQNVLYILQKDAEMRAKVYSSGPYFIGAVFFFLWAMMRRAHMRTNCMLLGGIVLLVGLFPTFWITLSFHENPTYHIGYILFLVPIMLWTHGLGCFYLWLASKKMTMKEDTVIKRQAKSTGIQIQYEVSLKDKAMNLVKFFMEEPIASEMT